MKDCFLRHAFLSLAVSVIVLTGSVRAKANCGLQEAQPQFVGTCVFNTAGWSKLYGEDSVEIEIGLRESSLIDAQKICRSLALNYADEHIGEGPIVMEKILIGPNLERGLASIPAKPHH